MNRTSNEAGQSARGAVTSRPRWFLWLAFLIALFTWSYWPALGRVLTAWRSSPDYSHGFLVLPIAIAVWMRRRGAEWRLPARPAIGGLFLVAMACLLRLVASQYYLLPLDAWSIPLWIGGVVWTFGGWDRFRTAMPAIAFLWFAMPLPDRFQELLSLPLQRQATWGSAWILQSLGQPAAASGTTLLLGEEVFEVERACSGLRMFFGTLGICVAFALLTPKSDWNRWILLIFVPPIALCANIVRIVLTVVSVQYAETSLTRRILHDFAGVFMVGLVCLMFAATYGVIQRVVNSYRRDRETFLRRFPVWPIAAALLVFAAVFWHQRQRAQLSGDLLAAATRYEDREEWSTAAGYLRSYLRFQPEDAEASARLARVLTRSAQQASEKRRALTAMTAAWKANPDDLELAREQAELAMDLRQYSQVIDTTAAVLSHDEIERAEHTDVRRLAARWRAAAMYEVLSGTDAFAPFSWNDVAVALTQAAELDRGYPQHALRLAILLRERLRLPSEQERIAQADTLLDRVVADNAESAEAWLARYLYRQRFVRRGDATPEQLAAMDADLQQAVRLDEQTPAKNVHVQVAAAERERGRGNLDASLAFYQEALKANPLDARAYLAISEIQVERGSAAGLEEAVNVLQQGLQAVGENELPLVYPLIEHLVVLQRDQEADAYVNLVRDRLQLYPDPARTHYQLRLQQVIAWRSARDNAFAAAADGLVEVLKSVSNRYLQMEPAFAAQTWAAAGQYRRMAGDWDEAVAMYQQAAALDDSWALEHRYTVAKRAETRGDFDAAGREYRELAKSEEQSLEAWLRSAYAELRQQLLLPATLRDWTAFRRSLESARGIAGDQQDQVILLEANYYLVIGQAERVIRMLEEGCNRYPDSLLLHRALALVLVRDGRSDEAIAIARDLPVSEGDAVSSLLLQHEILTLADRRQDALIMLEEAIQRMSGSVPVDLLLESARLLMQQGKWEQARTRLEQAAERDGTNLRVAELTSQLAWCLQDWDLLETCEGMLRTAEGDAGPLWRTFRIRRLLAQSSTDDAGNKPADAEVDELTRQLEILYPDSAETRIARGRVASFRGLLWQAVANYEEAWERGLPSVPLAIDLISLLNELGEVERAQKYVVEVRQFLTAQSSLIDDSLLGPSADTAESAIRLAEALVQENPRSETFLRLGRTLVLTALPARKDYGARLRRAEHAFRRAADTAPSDPRTWAALFRYLVSIKSDFPEAHDVLSRLRDNADISELNRTFTLAQLYESVGDDERAEPLYREALTLARGDVQPADKLVVLERSAQFFRRTDPALAKSCCEESLAIDARAIGARRILLDLLLGENTVEANRQARALVGEPELRLVEGDLRLRIEARTLLQAVRLGAQGADEFWRDAVELLGQVSTRTSEDAVMLAELYLFRQQPGDAIAELKRVAENLPKDRDLLLSFLRRWDRTLFSDTRLRMLAERIYDGLEESPADDLAALDLRLEMHRDRAGIPAEAVTQEFAATEAVSGGSGAYAGAVPIIARYARRAIARAPDEATQFRVIVRLMRHLLRTNRWDEAERLTRLTPDLLPPPVAATALATALSMTPLPPEQLALHQKQLELWRGQYSQNAPLVFALANLHLVAGEYDAAMEAYRRCHQLAPSHPMTLNNLALALLSSDPGAIAEAETLVQTAVSLGGDQPAIADSLGLIEMLSGKPAEAVSRWQQALAVSGGDPTILFHLAVGWARMDQPELARFTLGLALHRGLTDYPLLPLDRQLYEELEATLNPGSVP